jgi:hypothetical protein
MNAEWKAKWVSALRSEKYKQAQGELRREDGYCCLGVACDLADPNGWVENTNSVGVRRYTYKYGEDKRGCDLPDNLVVMLDLSENTMDTLITMNDNGKSFTEIADFIENHL